MIATKRNERVSGKSSFLRFGLGDDKSLWCMAFPSIVCKLSSALFCSSLHINWIRTVVQIINTISAHHVKKTHSYKSEVQVKFNVTSYHLSDCVHKERRTTKILAFFLYVMYVNMRYAQTGDRFLGPVCFTDQWQRRSWQYNQENSYVPKRRTVTVGN